MVSSHRFNTDEISRRDVGIATIVAILTLTFFIITLRPDVGGTEDSPKFQFVGRVLGTSHSPGYPFYAMATWLFGWLPVGNLAYRINLFSAVCGALSCVVIYLTSRRLGVDRLLAFVAALGAATIYPVWSNSVTAEVYTLAAVLSAGAIYFVIAFAQEGHRPASTREASCGEVSTKRPNGRGVGRLYVACALWACGFGNHVTIAGILPAALIYGVYKDRTVLRPRVAITAALIGIAGVLQYAFIAIRTMQGAPYLEARADTVMGVFDVIIARDVSWARFYQAQSAVAAIEVPMLLNGLRIHMGMVPFVLAAIAIVIGIRRRNAEVLVILGAAAGTLAFIANLWGDVVGFITPVCVQLWPLAALGLQWLVETGRQAVRPSGRRAVRPSGLDLKLAAAAAFIVPIVNVYTLWPSIDALRQPGEGPGVRALYSHLPAGSAVVAENYWLARLVNYMHFSGEVSPDPNPRVLNSDIPDVQGALDDGLQVYAFEGAANWLRAQGYRFEPTPIARVPFEQWLPQQRDGTLIVVATSGRPLPLEWLPLASRTQTGRGNFGTIAWRIGDPRIGIEQSDNPVITELAVGAEGRPLRVSSDDDGPRLMWGEDVLEAIDRGLIVGAFTPEGTPIGHWSFALDETPGAQLLPVPFALRGESACATLRPGDVTDVTAVLSDGAWWATVDGRGTAIITLDAGAPHGWRNHVAQGRGEASVDGSQLIMQPAPGTRAIFRFSMAAPPPQARATLQHSDGVQSVRVCQSEIPGLPASGAFEVTADRDAWFGSGWHLAERAGLQRFRWSERQSTLQWRMENAAPVRLTLRMRAANAAGATVAMAANGVPQSSCTLPAGAWTDCRIQIPAGALTRGINYLSLTSDTISPSADRPGDPRELSFVMQGGRARVGQ